MTGLRILAFVVAVLAFYSYVGHMVPQKITYPPETAEFSAGMTAEELAAVGQEIVAGKGTCLGCHTIGSREASLRFPDLGGIGARAASRVDGLDGIGYLAQSLYEPGAYIVDGFLPGMPQVNRPPIGLTDEEIRAVIAYLQSLGGEPTVTLATELPYETPAADTAPRAVASGGPDGPGSGSGGPGGGPDGPGGSSDGPGSGLDGPEVAATYLCASCHLMDAPGRLVGPSLFDVGARLSRAEIYEAVMDPDRTLAEGYPGGLMTATLTASGFYRKVSPEELRALVEFLASHRGGP